MLVGHAGDTKSVRTPLERKSLPGSVAHNKLAVVAVDARPARSLVETDALPRASAYLAEYLNLGGRCQYFEDLFESAPGAYLVTGLTGAIRRANQATGTLLGLDPVFLTHKPLAVFVPIDQRRAFRRQVNRFGEGERVLNWSGLLRRRGGAAFLVSYSVRRATSDECGAEELLWLLHPLASAGRPTAAEWWEGSSVSPRSISTVVPTTTLAGLAQDLRNPLRIIADQAAFLVETLVGERPGSVGDVALGLTGVMTVANQTLAALDEVADYAAFRSGQPLALHPIPTDLIAVIQRVVQSSGERTERHLLGFVVEERALRGIIADWDEERLERALENVVGEVVARSDAAGPITLRLDRIDEKGGSRACLTVAYTPENQPDPFLETRGGWETGRTRGRLRGESLGLAGSRWILDQLGGRLSLEKRPDGLHLLKIELRLDGCASEWCHLDYNEGPRH